MGSEAAPSYIRLLSRNQEKCRVGRAYSDRPVFGQRKKKAPLGSRVWTREKGGAVEIVKNWYCYSIIFASTMSIVVTT